MSLDHDVTAFQALAEAAAGKNLEVVLPLVGPPANRNLRVEIRHPDDKVVVDFEQVKSVPTTDNPDRAAERLLARMQQNGL